MIERRVRKKRPIGNDPVRVSPLALFPRLFLGPVEKVTVEVRVEL